MIGILLALLLCTAQADINIEAGLGKTVLTNHLSGSKESFERVGSVGYSYYITKALYAKAVFGGWLANGSGRHDSVFGGAMLGIRAKSDSGMFAHIGFGPAGISHPDSVLGSHFQFLVEAGLGVCADEVCIGVRHFHVSNAGIKQPNRGIDALGISLTLEAF